MEDEIDGLESMNQEGGDQNNQDLDTIDDVETLRKIAKSEAERTKQLAEKNKQLFERTKKAEEKSKKINKQEPEQDRNLVHEEILRERGYDDEDIQVLKSIQSFSTQEGKNLTLKDATQHPFFKDRLAKRQVDERRFGASLSSSGGSGYSEDNTAMPVKENGRVDWDKIKQNWGK